MSDDNEDVVSETEVEEQSDTEVEVKEPEEDSGEEKETPSESSTDDKPDVEEKDEESDKSSTDEKSKEEQDEKSEPKDVDVPAKEPKPVEGETPRERALRKELENQRHINREQRKKELFGKPERTEPAPTSRSEQKQRTAKLAELEKEFDPTELKNFRKALEAAAEDLGFVRKEELQASTYSQSASEELDKFIEKHPDYLPENDKDDVLWKQFQEEFALYKKPEDPRKLSKIFERVHQSVIGDKPTESKSEVDAKNQKIKSASHSASSGASRREPSPSTSGGKIDPLLRPYLKGDFSDLDL
jgi:hypothetical protein